MGGEREPYDDNTKDLDDTYILPWTAYVLPKPNKLLVPKGGTFSVFDEENPPPRSPYVPPSNTAIRVIAENVGSTMDVTEDVGEIVPNDVAHGNRLTDDDLVHLVNFSDEDGMSWDDPPVEEERFESQSLLRASAQTPASKGMRSATEPIQSTEVHRTDGDDLLDRNFQFSAHSPEIQRVAGAPLFTARSGVGTDAPANQPKRHDSLRVRLLSNSKGKGAGKEPKNDGDPREPLLRRGSGRVVSFVKRQAW